MRITIDDSAVRSDIQHFKKSIPKAAEAGGRAALQELAERLRDRVRAMIPDDGGWYDIYRESIELVEINPDHYELTTKIHEVTFGKVEADSSLIWISGGDSVANVLSQYNPWSLDTIPAIKDGLNCELVVRPASESEVEFHRRRQLHQRVTVEKVVERLGKIVYPLDAELPSINGRILADVPFLARRLEHGLGGFPRTPIWSRIDAEGNILAKDEAVQKQGHDKFAAEVWPKK
jgi:hypothetical protein